MLVGCMLTLVQSMLALDYRSLLVNPLVKHWSTGGQIHDSCHTSPDSSIPFHSPEHWAAAAVAAAAAAAAAT